MSLYSLIQGVKIITLSFKLGRIKELQTQIDLHCLLCLPLQLSLTAILCFFVWIWVTTVSFAFFSTLISFSVGVLVTNSVFVYLEMS